MNPKKKGCFLTTACVAWRGLPDYCRELTVLRKFRDEYMAETANGEKLVDLYYDIAPGLVERIEQSEDRDRTLAWIYGVVCRCVTAIEQEEPDRALSMYRAAVIRLLAEFPPEEDDARYPLLSPPLPVTSAIQ